MNIAITKSAHEKLTTLAGIRDQKISELLDDILERFDTSDLLLKPETVKRLHDAKPRHVIPMSKAAGAQQ